MDVFRDTLGFVVAVCIGLVFLTLFFRFAMGRKHPLAVVPVKDILRAESTVDVVLTDCRRIGPVRFVGFIDTKNNANSLPYPLSQLAVFERPDGGRVLIRPDSIRFIEEVSANELPRES